MARKKIAETRREEIVQAFYRCMVKRGYSNTTVRDIAREANVQSGIIHYYFESKDAILSALCQDLAQRYGQTFLAFAERHKSAPPQERLKLGINFFFNKVSKDKDLNKVFYEFLIIAQHNPELRQMLKTVYRNYRRLIADFISEWMKASDEQGLDAQDLADFLVCAFEGACNLYFTDSRGVSISRLAEIATRLINAMAAGGMPLAPE